MLVSPTSATTASAANNSRPACWQVVAALLLIALARG
jgi:hypothetical protein